MSESKPASASVRVSELVANGRKHHTAGRLAEAQTQYRAALAHEPENGKALELLGALLCQESKFSDAVAILERASAATPNNAGVLVNLGVAYRALGRAEEAAAVCRKAINLHPETAAAHFNLGHALRDYGDYKGAALAYRAYLALCPNDAEGHAILGDTLLLDGVDDDAIAAFEAALSYEPAHVNAHLNIAHVLGSKGWFHAALVVVEALACMRPNDPDAQKEHAALLLQLGYFQEGWRKFESRFESSTERIRRRPEPPPYWQGEDLSGKSVLLWTEQGLGDEILFASLIPEMIAKAKRVSIACDHRLISVLARSFPGADVVEAASLSSGPRGTDFDYQSSIVSLGGYLRPDFNCFPRHNGYLKADPTLVAQFRDTYLKRARGRRVVGLSWRSTSGRLAPNKSAKLINLNKLLQTPDVMFVNLQYGDCAAEIGEVRSQLGVEIFDDPSVDAVANVDIFFAQVAAMDLVITTSNTAAHVAGSQNMPAWILLPFSKGQLWYWFTRREDSPWYPSARLLRATKTDPSQPWESEPAACAAVELERLIQA